MLMYDCYVYVYLYVVTPSSFKEIVSSVFFMIPPATVVNSIDPVMSIVTVGSSSIYM